MWGGGENLICVEFTHYHDTTMVPSVFGGGGRAGLSSFSPCGLSGFLPTVCIWTT